MLSITLDWLAGTIKEPNRETHSFLLWIADSSPLQTIAATNGYTEAERSCDGVVISRNGQRSDMGIHVVFSGSALRSICERRNIHQKEILRKCIDAGCSISRLDLAKDLTGLAFDYGSVWRDIQSKAFTGATRTFNRIEGASSGVTIYAGSRQSERFLRLYDKAAQTGNTDNHWARLELECKGMTARAMATFLSTEATWAGAFDGQVKAMINLLHNPSWQRFFDRGDVPIGLPKLEKQTDTEKWIATQVYPALMRYAGEHPESKALRDLLQALMWLLRDRDET